MPDESTHVLRLQRATGALATEFRGVWSPETIARYLTECERELGEQGRDRYVNFLPLLAERFARERLWALAQAEGRVDKTAPEALFVCAHNAGRSQMAAALTRHLSDGRVSVRSAGSVPSGDVNPTVMRAMAEIGIDLDEAFPKPLTDEVVQAADIVVTMGCGDACPVYPGKRYENWDVPDPAGQPIETVREIRDDIRGRVTTLVAHLAPLTSR